MKSNYFHHYLILLVMDAVFGMNFVLCIGPYCFFCRRKVSEENEWISFQSSRTMYFWLFYLLFALLVDLLCDLFYSCAVTCYQLARDIIGKMRKNSSVNGLQGQEEKKLKRGKMRKN